MDAATGRILYAKNPDAPRFPASTTKIVTAYILATTTPPETLVTAPPDTEKITGSSLHLRPGETITAQDALAALMLRSANDAAHAVALHLAGTQEAFAQKMNDQAKKFGLANTNFVNPHGLNDANHLTTARDLALFTRQAMLDPRFREVAALPKTTIQRSLNTADTLLLNRNSLLKKNPAFLGVKTGYTRPAGRCFVGYAEKNNIAIVTVVLKSQNWEKDTLALADWAFATYSFRTPLPEWRRQTAIPVENGVKPEVNVVAYPLPPATYSDWDAANAKIVPDRPRLQAPVKKDTPVSAADLVLPDGERVRIVLTSTEEVDRRFLFTDLANPSTAAIVIGAAALSAYLRRRARRDQDTPWRPR